MKKHTFLILLLLVCCDEYKIQQSKNSVSNQNGIMSNKSEKKINLINKEKNTVRERFYPPKNYHWTEEKPKSFEAFIENFKLKNYGTKILRFDGTPIENQSLHEGVFDIDIGNKDLQQCADAVIRLRAEYLFKNKDYDKIKFHFTSGDLASWTDYKKGFRPIITGNSVRFIKKEREDGSYENFRNYLDMVFNYSGTISLNRETFPIHSISELNTGDILITPGSPGHVVFIAGTCQNSKGAKLYLLAEGYTPAQSIHILKNPYDEGISPWYHLNFNIPEIKTARYRFSSPNFRSFN